MPVPVMKNYIQGEWVDAATETFGDILSLIHI